MVLFYNTLSFQPSPLSKIKNKKNNSSEQCLKEFIKMEDETPKHPWQDFEIAENGKSLR